jgi:DNA-binding CsgD family transcriptional regulator
MIDPRVAVIIAQGESIYRKLGVANRTEAVNSTRQLGLLY